MQTRIALLSFLVAAPLVAQTRQRWNEMDYGPFLSATVEAQWPERNIALKGVAIRLANEGGVLFDTELLRVAAIWDGGRFLQLRGTTFDGAHGPCSRPAGRQIQGTAPIAGAAIGGAFTDPRPAGYGSMPREHGRWQGLHLSGDRVVLRYQIEGVDVLETFALESAETPFATRTLEFGARSRPLTLVVGDSNGAALEPAKDAHGLWTWREPVRKPERVVLERGTDGFPGLRIGAPARDDLAQRSGVAFRVVDGFAAPHARAGAVDGSLPRLNDGATARNDDDLDRNVWFDGKEARFTLDLGKPESIGRLHLYSWHRDHRAAIDVSVFGSDAVAAPTAKGDDPTADGWTRIADADTRSLGAGGKHAVAIADPDQRPLGTFRHLLFVSRAEPGDGTFFTEIDVFGSDHPRATKPQEPPPARVVALVKPGDGIQLASAEGGRVVLVVQPGPAGTRVKLALGAAQEAKLENLRREIAISPSAEDVGVLTRKDTPRWGAPIETRGVRAKDDAAYVVDTLTVPEDNPWKSWMRIGAFDFFADGRAAVSTWSGDVFVVSGIDASLANLKWKRFATGLYEPLGLRIVGDVVHVLGRDGITRLHDRNGDGEAEHYEVFNHDVFVTRNFHEYAFDLQTDRDGNFYFSKAGPVRPGGRGFDRILPHHGAILKVSKDGSKIETYATGFRAPNGIGISPTGQLTTGDNEGSWMPTCRLNWVEEGGFHGCVDTSHRDPKPTTYDPPLCWLPMNVDNSSGGQVWVTSGKWGPFENRLLHLSYGQCELYEVFVQEIDGIVQGGVVRFDTSFASSLMRGRFHASDGQLYVVGFKGWQTRAARDTAFQRVRFTGKPVRMPTSCNVVAGGLEIAFTDPIDAEVAADPANWRVEMWNYDWSQRYGSPEVSVRQPPTPEEIAKLGNEVRQHDVVQIASVTVAQDRRSVRIALTDMVPCMQMKVSMNIDALDGEPMKHDIHLTIHRIPKDG